MAYSTITIRICQFLIQIQGWYSHSSINSENMQKSEWTISWSGWESQEKILFEKLTKKILKIQSWKAGKKILFPFEKFYPKKNSPGKLLKILTHGQLEKFPPNFFFENLETQTSIPFTEKGEKGSLSCNFHHAVMKINLEAKQSNWHAILSSIYRK